MAGYGATECGPLLAINSALEHQYGTVGMMLPGIESRIEPVEGIDAMGGRVGRLFVRGPNVMNGYLKDGEASRKRLVEQGGWYDTGAVVDITRVGFLKLVGRVKRFAKISGEMISLTALEETLARRFGDRRPVAVVVRSDQRRGERIAAVTADAGLDLATIRETLKAAGFSDLAVPREIHLVKEVPKLGTGKIDYVALGGMMEEQPDRAG